MSHQDVTTDISAESVNKEEPDDPTPCSCFDHLPPEVFDLIFSQFRLKIRLRYRLVCKSWDERITHSATIPLRIRDWSKDSEIVERLEKCGFESVNVEFLDNSEKEMYDLPPVIWEKIGSKIRELTLGSSRAGDQVMKEILLNCHNLQFLSVDLKNGVPAESLCSVSTLESLENVAPKNLRKFEICIYAKNRKNFQLSSTTFYPEIWTNILEAFFRLFPKLTGFSYICYESGAVIHLCTFVREINQNEELKLATIMVRSLSGRISDIMMAMDTLATLSLKKFNFALQEMRYSFTKEDEDTFLNFFGGQKKLQKVYFSLCQSDGELFAKMLRAIFLQIVQSCPDLRQLYFCPKERHLPWLHNIREYTSTLALQKLSISSIEVSPNSLKFLKSYKQADQGLMVMRFIPIYAHITSLSIECKMSDEILQCVLHHMINLKIFKMLWKATYTDFALTGRRDNARAIGSSINRLQNLERLSIEWRKILSIIHYPDNIFREFQFPRLQYLSCFPPRELSLLANFGISMPALRTIELFRSGRISLKALVNLCQSTKKLHTLIIAKSWFSYTQIEELFQVCPSLQMVRCEFITVKRKIVERAGES